MSKHLITRHLSLPVSTRIGFRCQLKPASASVEALVDMTVGLQIVVVLYGKFLEILMQKSGGKIWSEHTRFNIDLICGFCPLAMPSAASQLISLDLFSSGQRNGFDLASP